MSIKRPVSENEIMRLRALKNYEVLDSLHEKEFDRITELASLICNTPISLISLLDENRQWFKSKVGLEVNETPRDIAFCQYAIMHEDFLEVEDTLLDERFVDNILVTTSPNIRFYAGYPLTDPYGHNLGTLCVMDRIPRTLREDQKRALELLAKNVIDLIIERKQKEEFRHFERMFRLSPDLICIYRPEAKFLMINPALGKLTGLENNKFNRDDWKKVIHPDDIDKVRSAFSIGFQENRELAITIRLLAANGTYRCVDWVISVEHATGHMFSLGRDVTDALELKNKLQHTTQVLQETNHVARIGGWEIDVNTMALRWTEMTREIHSLPKDYELDVNKAIEFYKEEEVREQVKEAIANAIAFGTPWSMEVQIIDHTGTAIWVQALGKAEMRNGKCHRVYGTFQDIDEKKKVQLENEKSQAILQAFVRHNPAAVAMFDRDMKYIAVSNAWLTDHHLTERNVIGESHYDLSPFITAKGRARHQRILAGAIEQHPEDATLLEGSDFRGYSAWEMRPWHLNDGSIGGIMIFTQDVTNRVEQREQLNIARVEAESASKAKTEFLANMSHELRTPLNGILGFTELALHTDADENRRQYLGLVIKSGHSLLKIINDILDYSQLESGMVQLVSERTELDSLLKKSIEKVAPEAKAKDLHIKSHIQPGIHPFIWTDAMRVKQILNNLLSNAVKFTDAGEVTLRVDRLNKQRDRATFRFSISDTGIGIHPTNQALIFEAFAQEDGSLTRKHGGTGLGLTVSNKLLQTMDSTLKLQSTPNVGSTFYFDLTVRASQH